MSRRFRTHTWPVADKISTRARGQRVEQTLKEIHAKVDELISSRRSVKEVLVVLDQDSHDAQKADFVLQDRSSRRQLEAAPGNPASHQDLGSSSNSSMENMQLVDIMLAALAPSREDHHALDVISYRHWQLLPTVRN